MNSQGEFEYKYMFLGVDNGVNRDYRENLKKHQEAKTSFIIKNRNKIINTDYVQ